MALAPGTFAHGFALDGRAAIVTGSTRGIGLAIASRLSEAGASVMCNAREAPGESLRDEMARTERMRFHAADVSTTGGASALVAAALDAFGGLDIVINNAGVQPSGEWADATVATFDTTIASNVRSVECMMRAALPALSEARAGAAIVNVASVRGERPGRRMAHYATSKAAIVALTRALAAELGSRSIRVNAVSPGLIDRPGLAASWPEGVQRFVGEAPLGRLGAADDVAAACLFLVSPAAAWITGVNLVVDGGISLVR